MFGSVAADAESRGKFFLFLNLHGILKKPALVILSAGPFAEQMETMSDTEIVAQALVVLRSIFGAENVPDPSDSAVSKWKSDGRQRLSGTGVLFFLNQISLFFFSVLRGLVLFDGSELHGQ